MKHSESPRNALGGTGIILMLAVVSILGSMAIHMMVPALPLLAADLSIDNSAAQRIVSFYLFGLAAGQLVVGPVLDRMGRRPVLMDGLAIYAIAACVGAVTESISALLTARIAQALGAAAGLVTARVMVGDLFDPTEAGRRQATLMSAMLLSPALAPVVGGVIAQAGGWRPVLALPGAVALAVAVVSWRLLPDSLPRAKQATVSRRLLRDYSTLLLNRRFLYAALTVAASSSALYMFLAAAPFLLISKWGLATDEAGYCLLGSAAAGIAGTQCVRWLEQRTNVLRAGAGISLAGALLALALALSGSEGWIALVAPISLVTFGAGLSAPSAMALVVHSEDGLSGTAASLAGATQMTASGAASSLLVLVADPSFLLMSCGIVAASLLALFCSLRV